MAGVVGGALRSRNTAVEEYHNVAGSIMPEIWADIKEKHHRAAAKGLNAHAEVESQHAMQEYEESFASIGTASECASLSRMLLSIAGGQAPGFTSSRRPWRRRSGRSTY